MKNSKLQSQNSQSGVTLLLSILILAGLTLITLSVGAFAIQELRASRAVIVTEPAISAAESAGEQGLWAIKRDTGLATCPTAVNQTLGNSTIVNSCKSYDEALFNIKGGIPFTFYLYNPNDIGDIDLSSYPYDWISITHVAGSSSISVTVTRWTGATVGINPTSTPVGVGSNQIIDIAPVVPDTEGRIKVVLSSATNNTVEVNTDQGMPTFPTIDSFGCSSRSVITDCDSNNQEIFGRRLNITVPE